MGSENPALHLSDYIIEHFGDSDGSWEYGHTPEITKVLSGLDQKHAAEFSAVVLTWDEDVLFKLAEPINHCDNKYLQVSFLYVQLFTKMTHEHIQYVAQDLHLHVEYLNKESWTLDLVNRVKDNLYEAMSSTRFTGGIDEYLRFIAYLDHEILPYLPSDEGR